MPKVIPTTAQLNAAFDALKTVMTADINAAVRANVPSFMMDETNSIIAKFMTTPLILRWATAAATGALNAPAPNGEPK